MTPEWLALPTRLARLGKLVAWSIVLLGMAFQAAADWPALPDRAPVPAGNPMTPDKIALGRKLFFDPALSRNGKVACATCQDAKTGADGRSVSAGIGGKTGRRNAPTVWNAAFQARLFWDGRAASLEEQAKGPFINPVEMGMPDHAAVERAVAARPDYRAEFRAVFGGARPLSIDNIAAAIATFERTLITPDTPYDRYARGDKTALDEAQLRGMRLFEGYGCRICHSGPNFSGASLFDTAMPFRAFPGAAHVRHALRGALPSHPGPGPRRSGRAPGAVAGALAAQCGADRAVFPQRRGGPAGGRGAHHDRRAARPAHRSPRPQQRRRPRRGRHRRLPRQPEQRPATGGEGEEVNGGAV